MPRDEPRDRDPEVAGAVDDEEPAPAPGRGRLVAVGLVGLLLGFVIAFIVVALGTGDDAGAPELAAMQEEVDELEAALEERDGQIAELEARLDEAEAAAGQRADDIETQREALDARAAALDEREAALEERQNALAERERAAEDADGDDTGPTFDDETTQGIVDRVVEQIRDLFQ